MRFVWFTLLLIFLLSAVCGASFAAQEIQTGMYVSLYGVDSAWWGMTPQNPQYQAYKNTDWDAILKRIKDDGFDTIYVLPCYWAGQRVMWNTDLPILRTNPDWIKLNRDMMEELLSAADKNHQRVVLCLLRMDMDAKWWKQIFPDEKWFDQKDEFANAFVGPGQKVSIPAMKEIVKKYGHHPSLIGFGVDEILYSGDYLKGTGLSPSVVGVEAIELYKKRFHENPPVMDPYPTQLSEKFHQLMNCRDDIMTEFHREVSDACKAEGKEYSTTLNASLPFRISEGALGGELAGYGQDTWKIANLPGNSDVAVDFYCSYNATHIQEDMTKFIVSPVYKKPNHIVLGTQFGGEIMAKQLINTMAEGAQKITYWCNYYYYGDKTQTGLMESKANPERVSYLVKAAKEFSKMVPIEPKYDVAILVNHLWQRNHFRGKDPRVNEICQMSHAVDALNMAGYRYDILSDEEAAAGGLKDKPAVVVPLGIGITDEALSALEAYVAGGGKLIVCRNFATQTPWEAPVSAEFTKRVNALLQAKGVYRLPKLLGDYPQCVLADVLKSDGVRPSSPFVSDLNSSVLPPNGYDIYWGPAPRFTTNGKIYDFFWSGDRYMAVSLGYRENWDGITYRFGRFSPVLKPYQNLILGKTSAKLKDYDLMLLNTNESVEIAAKRVLVFGKDGRWSEQSAPEGKDNVTLQGPVMVKIL